MITNHILLYDKWGDSRAKDKHSTVKLTAFARQSIIPTTTTLRLMNILVDFKYAI